MMDDRDALQIGTIALEALVAENIAAVPSRGDRVARNGDLDVDRARRRADDANRRRVGERGQSVASSRGTCEVKRDALTWIRARSQPRSTHKRRCSASSGITFEETINSRAEG